jgi:hypothetical protein
MYTDTQNNPHTLTATTLHTRVSDQAELFIQVLNKLTNPIQSGIGIVVKNTNSK